MCSDWRISIFVRFFAFAIKGNEKRDRKRKEKGSKYDWTQKTRIKNR